MVSDMKPTLWFTRWLCRYMGVEKTDALNTVVASPREFIFVGQAFSLLLIRHFRRGNVCCVG